MGSLPVILVAATIAITFAIIPIKFVGEKVLGNSAVQVNSVETITPQPSVVPEPTNTPTPSPIPTLSPTPIPPTLTPTPKPTPVVVSAEELIGYFNRYAGEYGVDVWQLRRIAECESGFNTNAANRYYLGLFQFSAPSWKNLRQIMGQDANPDQRVNPQEAIKTAAYAISIGRASIWPNCK